MQEIKRSGYDGLLPAGVVLTGGTAALADIRHSASRVMHLPARVAKPEELTGLVDKLDSPAYSTGVGLLHFAHRTDLAKTSTRRPKGEGPDIGRALTDFLGRFLPED
jgi:cell division protein FtsA